MPPPSSNTAPDFFIVGQPKTGSTALHAMLRQHPEIYMPEEKEPDFFATDLMRRPTPGKQGVAQRTLDDYLALFSEAGPGQIAGEASVAYLRSYEAAQNIAAFNKDARLIAMLREPAELLRSFHLQLLKIGLETVTDLRTALALERQRRRGQAIPAAALRSSYSPRLLLYSEQVRYLDQLNRFRAAFPPGQILVLIYDDFLSDYTKILRRICRFLGVDESVEFLREDIGHSVSIRSPRALAALRMISFGSSRSSRAAKQSIEMFTSSAFRRQLAGMVNRQVVGTKPSEDVNLMSELRAQYAPEVSLLSELLGRDLVSLWRR